MKAKNSYALKRLRIYGFNNFRKKFRFIRKIFQLKATPKGKIGSIFEGGIQLN